MEAKHTPSGAFERLIKHSEPGVNQGQWTGQGAPCTIPVQHPQFELGGAPQVLPLALPGASREEAQGVPVQGSSGAPPGGEPRDTVCSRYAHQDQDQTEMDWTQEELLQEFCEPEMNTLRDETEKKDSSFDQEPEFLKLKRELAEQVQRNKDLEQKLDVATQFNTELYIKLEYILEFQPKRAYEEAEAWAANEILWKENQLSDLLHKLKEEKDKNATLQTRITEKQKEMEDRLSETRQALQETLGKLAFERRDKETLRMDLEMEKQRSQMEGQLKRKLAEKNDIITRQGDKFEKRLELVSCNFAKKKREMEICLLKTQDNHKAYVAEMEEKIMKMQTDHLQLLSQLDTELIRERAAHEDTKRNLAEAIMVSGDVSQPDMQKRQQVQATVERSLEEKKGPMPLEEKEESMPLEEKEGPMTLEEKKGPMPHLKILLKRKRDTTQDTGTRWTVMREKHDLSQTEADLQKKKVKKPSRRNCGTDSELELPSKKKRLN